jgi:ATP-dependent Clp protease protease subunit
MNRSEFEKYAVGHLGMNSLALHDYKNSLTKSVYSLTPYVLEERQLNVSQIDVFSRLMMDRIIFLGSAIDDYVANVVNAQLLFLESADANKDVFIYINSPGGQVYAGLGMYDVMQYIKPEISTVCTGIAASMASVLLCAGQKGKRVGLPHSRVMIHQPSSGAQGQATDLEIAIEQVLKLKRELYEIISEHTGQSVEKIYQDSERDYWMRSDEAKAYGLIDEVISVRKTDRKDA